MDRSEELQKQNFITAFWYALLSLLSFFTPILIPSLTKLSRHFVFVIYTPELGGCTSVYMNYMVCKIGLQSKSSANPRPSIDTSTTVDGTRNPALEVEMKEIRE